MADFDCLSCFSASYGEARGKFLAACEERGLAVESRLNPHARAPDGGELFTDIARIGPAGAEHVLLLMSGTHGVEGYCGSGAQIGLLRSGHFDGLAADKSIVFVHAMNPYGFAHDRRVTEDNVDLNRNFLDFDAPERPTSDYGAIHEHILPADWDGPARKAANRALADYIEKNGMRAFQAAVSSGQYIHPDGVFYGGARPGWSNAMFRAVVADYLAGAKTIGAIDFHTGLGPYGYGELITVGAAEQKALAAKWYGDQVTDPDAGTSTSAPLDGVVALGISETLPDAALAFIALEFGTRDITTVLTALRGDNWLYHRGELESPLGAEIKAEIRSAFYPEEDDWKTMVWERSQEVVDMALNGLAGS